MDGVVTSRPFGPGRRLGDAEARQRARSTRLVLTDCDGVLTDGTVLYTAEGEHAKRFSFRDGMGGELAVGEVTTGVDDRALIVGEVEHVAYSVSCGSYIRRS